MYNLIRINEGVSLGLHGLAFLAQISPERISVKKLASILDVSEAHLAKVFQKLSKVGLIKSTRGPMGGFTLNKLPELISFLDIYEILETKIVKTKCPLGKEKCIFKNCIFSNKLSPISEKIVSVYESIKLSDFILEGN